MSFPEIIQLDSSDSSIASDWVPSPEIGRSEHAAPREPSLLDSSGNPFELSSDNQVDTALDTALISSGYSPAQYDRTAYRASPTTEYIPGSVPSGSAYIPDLGPINSNEKSTSQHRHSSPSMLDRIAAQVVPSAPRHRRSKTVVVGDPGKLLKGKRQFHSRPASRFSSTPLILPTSNTPVARPLPAAYLASQQPGPSTVPTQVDTNSTAPEPNRGKRNRDPSQSKSNPCAQLISNINQ